MRKYVLVFCIILSDGGRSLNKKAMNKSDQEKRN